MDLTDTLKEIAENGLRQFSELHVNTLSYKCARQGINSSPMLYLPDIHTAFERMELNESLQVLSNIPSLSFYRANGKKIRANITVDTLDYVDSLVTLFTIGDIDLPEEAFKPLILAIVKTNPYDVVLVDTIVPWLPAEKQRVRQHEEPKYKHCVVLHQDGLYWDDDNKEIRLPRSLHSLVLATIALQLPHLNINHDCSYLPVALFNQYPKLKAALDKEYPVYNDLYVFNNNQVPLVSKGV